MTTLPLVIRELRAEARRPLHFWLRAGAVFLMTGFASLAVWENLDSPGHIGMEIFEYCVPALLIGCWLVLPAVASDCISMERREGTLGLLFLTPLKPFDILAGKITLQTVRVFIMMLAVLPVVVIGFLFGGVSNTDVVSILSLILGSLALLVSGTLLASTLSTQFHRALLAGYGVAGATFGGVFRSVHYVAYHFGQSSVFGEWIYIATFIALAVSLSALYLGLALFFLKRARHDEPRSPAAQRWDRRLGVPVLFRPWFQRHQTRLLDRNPIAWLQQRGWGGRATKWGVCLALAIAQSTASVYDLHDARALQPFLGAALVIALSAAAVLSFARERQSGALELLLVTPLQPGQLLWGRLVGLWLNFLPAAVLLGSVWWLLNDATRWRGGSFDSEYSQALLAGYFAVPIIGYAVTLRVPRFGIAWAFTLALGVALPIKLLWLAEHWNELAYGLVPRGWGPPEVPRHIHWPALAWLAVGAVAAGWLAWRSLRDRTFATRTT